MIIDSSGFDELAEELAAAAREILPEVNKVVSRGALNIKRQIQADFRGSEHFKGVRDIRYNRKVAGGDVEAEIGPYVDSEGFGSLVGIAINGGSRGGGGSVPDPLIALQAEEPRFLQALEDVVGAVIDD